MILILHLEEATGKVFLGKFYILLCQSIFIFHVVQFMTTSSQNKETFFHLKETY